MKTNLVKCLVMLIVVTTFSIYQVKAQTYFNGQVVLGNCLNPGLTGFGCTDVFIGTGAGNSVNANNANNSFLGDIAGRFTTSGSNNTLMGFQSGYQNTIGNGNSAFGVSALYTNSTGKYNVALGDSVLFSNTGSYNTATGTIAAVSNTTGICNSFYGYGAGFSNQTGSNNTFNGLWSGANNTASNNTFYGTSSGYNNTSGQYNTNIGINAGYNNQVGVSNTYIGYYAGCGPVGLNSNSYNTFCGNNAGKGITTGDENAFFGSGAGLNITSGNSNVCVGSVAGQAITSGVNNIYIGAAANANGNYSGSINIGGIPITNNNQGHFGNLSMPAIQSQAGWTIYSDRRIKNNIQTNVPGLAFIRLLNPVTYNLDVHKENNLLGYPTKTIVIHQEIDSLGNIITPGSIITTIDTTYWNGKYDIEKIKFTGLIAQQVDSAAQKIGYDFSGISKPKNSNEIYSLNYAQFVVPLIKAVQELSKIVDSLKTSSHITNSMREVNTGNTSDTTLNRQTIILSLPDLPSLGDAQPNPNFGSTQIPYYIPENTSNNAKIIFTDMLGNIMQETSLQSGYGLLNINTQKLPSGVYSYNLVIDGKVIDSKKIIRNK